MKQKRFISFLLTLCMILSMVPATVLADTTGNITVNVSIAQDGKFVSGKDSTKLAYIPITVTDVNENDIYDIDDVLYATHQQYYDGGAENGYASENTEYGLSLRKLWGDESGAFGYYKNNQSAMSLADAVSNGDSIYAFIYQDQTNWSDTYTYFENTNISVAKNETVSVKLNKFEFDKNWTIAVLPVVGAAITIDGNNTEYTTNEEGAVEIVFENTGRYTISATTDYISTPPICIVSVAENAESENVPSEDNNNRENPDTPPDTEKKDYNIVIPNVLDKIAATYQAKTDEWTVMDMGAYENYAPETENKLTDSARQTFINSAISIIQDPSTSDTAIDKAVLGLAAIGKNPELLYPVNSNTPVSAIEKLNGVEKSASAWSAPYTLAAYNQGDYNTDSYETEIIDTLLANQEEDGSWNEWGTIDTTANVIAGLSFYKENSDINTAIENAINYLSSQQNEDATYSDAYSGANSNSTAMVIIGLSAAGVDLINDNRFIKNGKNIIDGLLLFMVAEENGFGYTDNVSINSYSTEQAFRALIAFAQTMKTGEAYNIYDFSKNELTPARETSNSSSSSAPSEPSGDNITVTMTIKADTDYWLNNYSTTIPSEGATVYHAFVKACSANSITHQGAANGYVSSITKGDKTLAEFDKGENSGWLYKVNGELPTVGLTDFSISDGDSIVWYYTEDWTKDPSAGHYGSSSSTANKTENKAENKTEVKTETTVSGNTAKVTTSEKNITNAISNAEKNNNSSIVISSSDTKNATDITLEISANSVKEIADNGGLSLSVETKSGNVDLSKEVLNAIAKQSGNNEKLNIAIKTKSVDEIADISNDEIQNAIVVEVTISSGDTNISEFDGHSLSVEIPADGKKHEEGKTYKVYIISSDGSVETTYGECVESNGQLYVSVQTNHLSSFVVTDIKNTPFTDTMDHWAFDAIEYVYNHSIMQGVSETEFAPDDTMTRAMLVTVLYRLENKNEKAKSHNFADVKDGEWYADAINWAAEKGIAEGVSETEFAPNTDITREQTATVLYRYAQYKEQDTSVGEDTNILSYTDAEEVSEYAISAMQWMVGAGLMNGETESTINSQNNSTRAQVATILMRYLEQ